MTNDQGFVIRAKDGTEIDLIAYLADHLGCPVCRAIGQCYERIIIDALVAALSVPKREPLRLNAFAPVDGWNDALDKVRQAAGVVERGEG